MGLIGPDQTCSFEQLVLDNESIDYLNHIFSGFDVNDELIALDTIKNVGIGGNFLMEEHTLKHMSDNIWESDLFLRDNWDNFQSKKEDIYERAHKKVTEIFNNNYPPKPVLASENLNKVENLMDKILRAQQ